MSTSESSGFASCPVGGGTFPPAAITTTYVLCLLSCSNDGTATRVLYLIAARVMRAFACREHAARTAWLSTGGRKARVAFLPGTQWQTCSHLSFRLRHMLPAYMTKHTQTHKHTIHTHTHNYAHETHAHTHKRVCARERERERPHEHLIVSMLSELAQTGTVVGACRTRLAPQMHGVVRVLRRKCIPSTCNNGVAGQEALHSITVLGMLISSESERVTGGRMALSLELSLHLALLYAVSPAPCIALRWESSTLHCSTLGVQHLALLYAVSPAPCIALRCESSTLHCSTLGVQHIALLYAGSCTLQRSTFGVLPAIMHPIAHDGCWHSLTAPAYNAQRTELN